jgi:hypothetical protein
MDNAMDPVELKLIALSLRGRGEGQGKEGPCPDDETFGAFMDGLLSQEEADKIRAHVLVCGDCHRAYTAWKEMAHRENPALPDRLLEAARGMYRPSASRLLLKVMKKAFEILNPGEAAIRPSLQPDTAAVRGSSALPEHHYEIVDVDPRMPHLEGLRIQHLQDTGAVKLTLIPAPDVSAEVLGDLRIDLYAGENLVQSWPVFEEGTSLNPVEKGCYRLEMKEVFRSDASGRDRVLGSMELELRD